MKILSSEAKEYPKSISERSGFAPVFFSTRKVAFSRASPSQIFSPRDSVTERVSNTSAGSVARGRRRFRSRSNAFSFTEFLSVLSPSPVERGLSFKDEPSRKAPAMGSRAEPDNIAATASYRAASSSKSPAAPGKKSPPGKKRRAEGLEAPAEPGVRGSLPVPETHLRQAPGVVGVSSREEHESSSPAAPLGGSNTRISSRSTRKEDDAEDDVSFRLSALSLSDRASENAPRAPEAWKTSPLAGSSGRSAGCAHLSWSAVTVTFTASKSFAKGNKLLSGCFGFLNAASTPRIGVVHALRRAPGGWANVFTKRRAHEIAAGPAMSVGVTDASATEAAAAEETVANVGLTHISGLLGPNAGDRGDAVVCRVAFVGAFIAPFGVGAFTRASESLAPPRVCRRVAGSKSPLIQRDIGDFSEEAPTFFFSLSLALALASSAAAAESSAIQRAFYASRHAFTTASLVVSVTATSTSTPTPKRAAGWSSSPSAPRLRHACFATHSNAGITASCTSEALKR